VTDITWQRHLEESLEQTKTRYQTLFEHAGDAILIHDLSGRLVAANQLACWRLGYSLEELLGMTMADIEAPEYAEQLEARTQELQRYGQHLFETEHVRCDGKRIPIETSSRLTEYEGQPAILVIARDITERKQMQQTMLSTERLAAMGQLATAIAHEINHPLQSVLGNVNILLSFPLEEELRQERLEIVYREAKRLIGLTRQVLDFARPTLAERRLLSVADVMGYAMTLVGGELRHSRVGVQMELSRELPFVRASKDELTQVFLNLIINAMEAMPGGGQLYIRGRAIKDTIELTFADTGPGIEPGMEERIFEAFHTTKENGTGLGLAVSQTIIQQHGGTIAVSNGTRGGAVFRLTLPIAVMEKGQE
jgi:PAS domain S-box-containing protein